MVGDCVAKTTDDAMVTQIDPVGARQTRLAVAVVSRWDSRVLLQRAARATLGARLWAFPAGHVESNETPAQCIRRELREEIGRQRMTLLRYHGPVRDTWYGGRFEVHLFHWRWRSGIVRLNGEHSAFAWVSQDDYRWYEVMPGVDEDLAWLDVWPKTCLNQHWLPASLQALETA